jgi:DNA-binding NarL/FixJ family response regulator
MAANVLVVDQHPVVSAGVAEVLTRARYRVTTTNAVQAERVAGQIRPSLVIAESRMAGRDGLALLVRLREKVGVRHAIVFSEYENPTFVARSVALGIDDYLLKSSTIATLVQALRNLDTGIEPGPDTLYGRMKSYLREEPQHDPALPDMTVREYQVLRHLGFGLSNYEIGSSLGISVETIKEHVQNILRKLHARDRTGAAVLAVRCGVS